MTVRDIVAEYLRDNGYDGLCRKGNHSFCACSFENIGIPRWPKRFMQCQEGEKNPAIHNCIPGHICEDADLIS
jgi:hypothetical protein